MYNNLNIKSESEKELDNMRLRRNLAECCLEACKSTLDKMNECIYSAWTHLAKVDELHVDMAKYDSLQFNRQPDYKAYAEATKALEKLRELINCKEVQVYEELYK